MHYQLRTEGDTPWRVAASVALGVLVGNTPFYGLHLPMCIALARLLRLSRIRAYLAAHVNNPLTFPFLIYLQVGVGNWLFTGRWLGIDLDELRQLRLVDLGRDLLVGSVVVGAGLGLLLGAAALAVSSRWQRSRFRAHLEEEVSRRYADAGVFHWEFVRGKLRHDPMYFGVLRAGVLPPSGRLVDFGCGRGLLLALLRTAADIRARGDWPHHWPEPPAGLDLVGVEVEPRLAEAARHALGAGAEVVVADLTAYEPPVCEVAVLLDVMHYLPAAAQETLLARVARALAPGGLVLIREADARAGLRFLITRAGERAVAWMTGRRGRAFHYRGTAEWVGLLERHGLSSTSYPMWAGTPFANVLIEARKEPSRGRS